MSLPTKLGFGLLTLSAVTVPGVWIVISSEPSSTTIADSSGSQYTGNFGEDFKHHFVDAESEKNQGWWDWSFKYRWQSDSDDDKDQEFKQIPDSKNLKEKCKLAYAKETEKDIHEDSHKKYEKSIWRYCSLEGQKPFTLQDLNDKGTTGTSSKETIRQKHAKDLVSTQDARNNKFWEIQEKAFFKTKNAKVLENKEKKDSTIFQQLYNKNPETDANTLAKACAKEFDKEASKTQGALMFCSLNPKASEKNKNI